MNQLVPVAAHAPTLIRAAGERAQTRFWEFFGSNIGNLHPRPACGRCHCEELCSEAIQNPFATPGLLPASPTARGRNDGLSK